MKDDPIVEEIRAIRQSIAEEFNHDLDAIVDHLRAKEKLHPERFEPKRTDTEESKA